MALKALGAQQFTDYSLQLGSDDYARHVSSVIISPKKGAPVSWKGGKPDAIVQGLPNQAQTITIEYAQDWATADSLAIHLLENEGEEVEAVFKPNATGAGPTFTATVLLVSGQIGGAIDTVHTASAALPVIGDVAYAPSV